MKKIILDTNFLLIPFQFKVDIFSEIDRICAFEYKLYILDKTLDELKKIAAEQGGKERMAARLAVGLLAAKKVDKIRTWSKKSVDEILIGVSGKKDLLIATQDKELKKKLRCPVIVMKAKSHLGFEEYNQKE